MKKNKGYKAVAIVYLLIAIVNVVFICNFDNNNVAKEKVENNTKVVVNYDNN